MASENNDVKVTTTTNDYHNFYTIKDFYEFIRKPDNLPTTHRHFQVFFYPQYNIYKNYKVLRKEEQSSYNFMKMAYDNIESMFSPSIFERITLSIQAITLPQQYVLTDPFNIKSPIGNFNTFKDGFLNGQGDELTFIIIDQIVPQFETFFNKWIYICSLCETQTGYTYGYTFPRVNLAIKYFKQSDPNLATPLVDNLKPNFIYYFTGVFPVRYDMCKINHSASNDEEISRKVVLKYNMCYVLPSRAYAKRYKLDYLFNTVNEQIKYQKWQDQVDKAAKELQAAQQKQISESMSKTGGETEIRNLQQKAKNEQAQMVKNFQEWQAGKESQIAKQDQIIQAKSAELQKKTEELGFQQSRNRMLQNAVSAQENIVLLQNSREVYAEYLRRGDMQGAARAKQRMLEQQEIVKTIVDDQTYNMIIRTNNSTEANKIIEQRLKQSNDKIAQLNYQTYKLDNDISSHQQKLHNLNEEMQGQANQHQMRLAQKQMQDDEKIQKAIEQQKQDKLEYQQNKKINDEKAAIAEEKLRLMKLEQQKMKDKLEGKISTDNDTSSNNSVQKTTQLTSSTQSNIQQLSQKSQVQAQTLQQQNIVKVNPSAPTQNSSVKSQPQQPSTSNKIVAGVLLKNDGQSDTAYQARLNRLNSLTGRNIKDVRNSDNKNLVKAVNGANKVMKDTANTASEQARKLEALYNSKGTYNPDDDYDYDREDQNF